MTEGGPGTRSARHTLPRIVQRMPARWWIVAGYVLIALVSTYQRGIASRAHTTFPIFRQSFPHLLHGTNLYALYPHETGARPFDLFKYSPTAAMLLAPLAAVPFVPALLAWDLLNALLLFWAVTRVLAGRAATLALALLLPQVLAAVQSSSSNALVAALLILAFAALEDGRQLRGAAAIGIGAALKIFPLAGVVFAALRPRRPRFVLRLIAVAVVLALLPLLAVPPAVLLREYRWWVDILLRDAADLRFGDSLIAVLRRLTDGAWPSWPLQLTGTLALLAPVVAHRAAWTDPAFRRLFLCSLLVYVVLFNHQAEPQSYVIAATGLAIWYVTGPRTAVRTLLTVLVMLGLHTVPATLAWLLIQRDLVARGRIAAPVSDRPEAVEYDVATLEPVDQPG